MQTERITWTGELKHDVRPQVSTVGGVGPLAAGLEAPQAVGLMKRHKAFKSERMQAVLKLQDRLFRIVRDEMSKAGYLELQAPIIGPATDPGIRGARQVSFDYYGTEFKIMSSMILYKQMAANSLGRIYSFSPNVRLEPETSASTGRHLAEFYQIDMEEADGKMEDTMAHIERLLTKVSERVKYTCKAELKVLGRRLDVPDDKFKVYTYEEAREKAEAAGVSFAFGEEVPWEAEAAISKTEKHPFWDSTTSRTRTGRASCAPWT